MLGGLEESSFNFADRINAIIFHMELEAGPTRLTELRDHSLVQTGKTLNK